MNRRNVLKAIPAAAAASLAAPAVASEKVQGDAQGEPQEFNVFNEFKRMIEPLNRFQGMKHTLYPKIGEIVYHTSNPGDGSVTCHARIKTIYNHYHIMARCKGWDDYGRIVGEASRNDNRGGRDLADGGFNTATVHQIFGAIIAYEAMSSVSNMTRTARTAREVYMKA